MTKSQLFILIFIIAFTYQKFSEDSLKCLKADKTQCKSTEMPDKNK